MALATATEPQMTQPHMTQVRCGCLRCGAHTMGALGYTLGGSCQNCGSYELEPMSGAATLVGA